MAVLAIGSCDRGCRFSAEQSPNAGTAPIELARGVNLGDMLEAPVEGEWGQRVQQHYFDLIARAGFDFVRLPVKWSGHLLAGSGQGSSAFSIDPDFFDRVDEVVCWALERDLSIIIDLHHYDEMQTNPDLVAFVSVWRQIAEHYRHAPPQVLFELLNEPRDAMTNALWNRYAAAALQAIRESNPHREVVIGPSGINDFSALADLDLPRDSRLIVTFHYYHPIPFTHQGAVWLDGSEAWLGTDWQGTEAERLRVIGDFDVVSEWAREHGDARILLGEFGAYKLAPQDSRIRWTAFVREQAEARGFAWSYWEFASGFGIYDPESGRFREDLYQALMPTRGVLRDP